MPVSEIFKRGAVGIGEREADFHPDSWRRRIKKIELRVSPLTALMKTLRTEKTDSFRYHWPVQPHAAGRGSVTDVFTSASLAPGDAYVSGGVAGTILYVQMTADDVRQVIATDVITVINSTTKAMRRCYVQSVVEAGAESYCQVVLRETDTDNALAGATLTFTITGNAQAEFAPLPTALYGEPTWFVNQCQNFMESIELSNRELIERERVDPHIRKRARLQAFKRLMQKKEYTYLFGKYDVQNGPNGKPITFTEGLVTAIEDNEPGNVWDYKTTTDFNAAGKTWLAGGLDFFDGVAEQISRKGEASHKTVFTGGLGVTLINQLIRSESTHHFMTGQTSYGLKIHQFITPNQDWHIIEHPLFSENPEFRNSMLIFEKHLVGEKVLQPLKHISGADKDQNGFTYVSGIKEGWECDTGLIYENLEAMAWITNIGVTNTESP